MTRAEGKRPGLDRGASLEGEAPIPRPPPTRRCMAAKTPPGRVGPRRWHGDGDVRGYRPPSGWSACADLTDIHPITGHALPRAVWWLIETKE